MHRCLIVLDAFRGQRPHAGAEHGKFGDQVVDVAIEEAVLEDLLEGEVQDEPEVVDGHETRGRPRQQRLDILLVAAQQPFDNLLLAPEMVVQVPLAHTRFGRDPAERHLDHALGIEQREARGQDAVARARRRASVRLPCADPPPLGRPP